MVVLATASLAAPAPPARADEASSPSRPDTTFALIGFLATFQPTDTVAVPLALPSPGARAWQTGLLRADRIHHASLALASGAALGILSREPSIAAGGALLLGLIKEVRDAYHTGFDWTDLAADAIGAAAATLLTTDLVR